MAETHDRQVDIIVVDDDAELAASLQHYLQRKGCAVRTCTSAKNAFTEIALQVPDVIVSDLRMPEISGMELLNTLGESNPGLPLILIAAHGDVTMAVEAMRGGAFDFIEKPFEPDHLYELTQRAAQMKRLGEENRRLKSKINNLTGLEKNLIGISLVIRQLREEVSDIATTVSRQQIWHQLG